MATPPSPPNWAQSLQEATMQVQSPYIKIPVSETSAEYRELNRLSGPALGPGLIMERIVNPSLWKRFCQARRDLLVSKSDDLGLLSDLGLNQEEVAQKAHINMNFGNAVNAKSQYSDNICILFHGTSSATALEQILSQGLDERLGNSRYIGHLGRGIYFADDPRKAMQYDENGILIVFAVILGDCLTIRGQNTKAVREPEKLASQRRNHEDLFFDSIVGNPTGLHQEFVIYNRYHCCPIYTIRYNKLALPPAQPVPANLPTDRPLTSEEKLALARRQLPSFAWCYKDEQQVSKTTSPFLARKIFQAMAPDQIVIPADAAGAVGGVILGHSRNLKMKTSAEFKEDEFLALKLSELTELGFVDHAKNIEVLHKFGYNLERAIDYLVVEAMEDPGETTTTANAFANVPDRFDANNGRAQGQASHSQATRPNGSAPTQKAVKNPMKKAPAASKPPNIKDAATAEATTTAKGAKASGLVAAGPSSSKGRSTLKRSGTNAPRKPQLDGTIYLTDTDTD